MVNAWCIFILLLQREILFFDMKEEKKKKEMSLLKNLHDSQERVFEECLQRCKHGNVIASVGNMAIICENFDLN